jgi:hypothetical protein
MSLGTILAVISLALAAASVSNAATLVQSTYFDSASQNCGPSGPNVSACEVLFAPIPANKILLIQQVSCAITLTDSRTIIRNLEVQRRNGSAAVVGFQKLAPVSFLSEGSGERNYHVNNSVLIALDENDRPAVAIKLVASISRISMTCSIHGVRSDA